MKDKKRIIIIAEIGINHNGDLNLAKKDSLVKAHGYRISNNNE